jgi:hypothetical protein
MKKRITGIVALAVLLLLCSCQTKPMVWDENYPEEKLATVLFMDMAIESYNGIDVTRFNWVRIPAGEARIGGTITVFHAGVNFHARDTEFSSLFNEGGSYILRGATQGGQWGVAVYEGKNARDIKQENMLTFIPFKEQPRFH